jgi:Secretion system C-terminal sorting domain
MLKDYLSKLLVFAVLCWAVNTTFAQTPCANPLAIVCDNFDDYTLGSTTGGQAAFWTTWSGTTGGAEDGIVSDEQAASAPHSMLIAETQITQDAQDVLLLLGNKTTGIYRTSWKMYIPANATGYYNIQEDENPGVVWNLDVFFNKDGLTPGTATVDQTGTTFTYPENAWFDVAMVHDLDNDLQTLYIDTQLVETTAYTGSLGAIDFFSIDALNRYYVDDVEFASLIVSVTFAVDLTYYLDAGNTLETVKIAGNFGTNGASLPDWSPPDAPVFTDMGDDIWSATIEFPAASAGQELEFKFLNTADSWGDCGLQQECMGEEDAACKAGGDNRLLVIPAENTDLCFTWETCLGCNVVATREFIEIPMSIAPNPFSNQTIVSFNSELVNGQARLTSITGQVMKIYAVNGPQLVIERDNLASGMYFLNVVTEDGMSAAQKLMVE